MDTKEDEFEKEYRAAVKMVNGWKRQGRINMAIIAIFYFVMIGLALGNIFIKCKKRFQKRNRK